MAEHIPCGERSVLQVKEAPEACQNEPMGAASKCWCPSLPNGVPVFLLVPSSTLFKKEILYNHPTARHELPVLHGHAKGSKNTLELYRHVQEDTGRLELSWHVQKDVIWLDGSRLLRKGFQKQDSKEIKDKPK